MDIYAQGLLVKDNFLTVVHSLPQDARIHMSESDFYNITQNGALCNGNGEKYHHQEEIERVLSGG